MSPTLECSRSSVMISVFGEHRQGVNIIICPPRFLNDELEQVEEIVTMEDTEFAQMAPVYGLIFLFKWTQDMAQAHRSAATCVENSNIYFAKQAMRNDFRLLAVPH